MGESAYNRVGLNSTGGRWPFAISKTPMSAAARLAEVVREDPNGGNNVHNVFGEGAVQRGEQRWIWYAIREWRDGKFPLVEVARLLFVKEAIFVGERITLYRIINENGDLIFTLQGV